jgi:hypothetical protein
LALAYPAPSIRVNVKTALIGIILICMDFSPVFLKKVIKDLYTNYRRLFRILQALKKPQHGNRGYWHDYLVDGKPVVNPIDVEALPPGVYRLVEYPVVHTD